MKNVKKITIENHLNILENLQYGENLIIYDNEQAKKITLEKVTVLNAYFDSLAIYEGKPSFIELSDGSFSNNLKGVISLVYCKHNCPIPLLHQDNYDGEEILKETANFENISRHLNIDVKLRKYYRNLGLILNVKFRENRFDATNRKGGKPKKIGGGVIGQIRESYLNGDKSICFSSYRSNLQSVRNAVSSFGKMVNKKFAVEVHGYEIFVIFRDFTENEKNEILLKNVIMSMKKIDTKEHITALFHEFLDFEFPEEQDEEKEIDTDLDDEEVIDLDDENTSDNDGNDDSEKHIENNDNSDDELYLDTRFDNDNDDDEDGPEPIQFDWDSLDKEDEDDGF